MSNCIWGPTPHKLRYSTTSTSISSPRPTVNLQGEAGTTPSKDTLLRVSFDHKDWIKDLEHKGEMRESIPGPLKWGLLTAGHGGLTWLCRMLHSDTWRFVFYHFLGQTFPRDDLVGQYWPLPDSAPKTTHGFVCILYNIFVLGSLQLSPSQAKDTASTAG